MLSGGSNENISLLPDNPSAQIMPVQGGGGQRTRGWLSLPVVVEESEPVHFLKNHGTLLKFQNTWKQTLGPNVPSRRKPRHEPYHILGKINVNECQTFVVAPLHGDIEASNAVFAWSKSLLDSDDRAHIVFMGPIFNKNVDEVMEGNMLVLLSKYPGRVLHVSDDSSIPSIHGLMLEAVPYTGKQVVLGSIPDYTKVYNASSRSMGCLEVTVLRTPFLAQGAVETDESIFHLAFDKPTRVKASSKDFEEMLVTKDHVFKQVPGWVTKIAFGYEAMTGGLGTEPTLPPNILDLIKDLKMKRVASITDAVKISKATIAVKGNPADSPKVASLVQLTNNHKISFGATRKAASDLDEALAKYMRNRILGGENKQEVINSIDALVSKTILETTIPIDSKLTEFVKAKNGKEQVDIALKNLQAAITSRNTEYEKALKDNKKLSIKIAEKLETAREKYITEIFTYSQPIPKEFPKDSLVLAAGRLADSSIYSKKPLDDSVDSSVDSTQSSVDSTLDSSIAVPAVPAADPSVSAAPAPTAPSAPATPSAPAAPSAPATATPTTAVPAAPVKAEVKPVSEEATITISLNGDDYKIREPSESVIAEWGKKEFKFDEAKLLEDEGIYYSDTNVYSKLLTGLATGNCLTEANIQLKPECSIFRYIMARSYYRKVKGRNTGKPSSVNASVGTEASDSADAAAVPGVPVSPGVPGAAEVPGATATAEVLGTATAEVPATASAVPPATPSIPEAPPGIPSNAVNQVLSQSLVDEQGLNNSIIGHSNENTHEVTVPAYKEKVQEKAANLATTQDVVREAVRTLTSLKTTAKALRTKATSTAARAERYSAISAKNPTEDSTKKAEEAKQAATLAEEEAKKAEGLVGPAQEKVNEAEKAVPKKGGTRRKRNNANKTIKLRFIY